MRATVSIVGLYTYNPDLFSDWFIPDEMTDFDFDVLIANLLYETAELEAVIANPQWMQWAIGTWSAKQAPVWLELYKTQHYVYNPIHNYDRDESLTLQRYQSSTFSVDNAGTDTSNEYIAAFNDSGTTAATPKAKVTIDKGTKQYGGDSLNYTDTHTAHISGNIGVMSTQDMINQQRETVQFNLYDYIIQDFKNRFCLQVY